MRLLPLLSFLVFALPAAAQTHQIGIVPPNGEWTIAFDENAAGQVAAVLEDRDGRQRGVLYDKGVLTELGVLADGHSDTKAINPDGVVVGSTQIAGGHWRAYLYERAHGRRLLGTLGGDSSNGTAINHAGQAAGYADTANGESHAFLYDGTTMKDLGTLGGNMSYAAGMNNKGQVVGTAVQADGWRRAFVWDAEHGMVALGTLGGRVSSATAVNDAGVIVGASEMPNRRWHAFMVQNGKMIDIGAMIGRGSSFATGINNAGHVVGSVFIGDERCTFVYRDGKVTVHRGGKGLYLTNGINDADQVIGAVYMKRLDAATMPSDAIAAVAPTPSSKLIPAGLLSVGVAAAAVVWRRRYRGIVLAR